MCTLLVSLHMFWEANVMQSVRHTRRARSVQQTMVVLPQSRLVPQMSGESHGAKETKSYKTNYQQVSSQRTQLCRRVVRARNTSVWKLLVGASAALEHFIQSIRGGLLLLDGCSHVTGEHFKCLEHFLALAPRTAQHGRLPTVHQALK